MISHKTLGHPATLFGLGVVCFIIGLKGTMLIDDAVRADRAVEGVQMAEPAPSYGTTSTPPPSGALLSGPIVSPDSFVGIWQEEWGGVQSELWIHNSFVNGAPLVSKPGNWRVGDVRYENGVLSFQAYGGDSDWSFTYWVTYNTSERMTLRVARHHDNAHFDGYLNRTGAVPPEPTDSYSSSPPEGVPGGVSGGVVGGVPGGSPGGVVGGYEEPAPPRGPVRVSGDVLMQKLIDRVDPQYPAIARSARVQGVVVLEVVVDVDGTVRSTRVMSGHPLLTQAAIEAVRQWGFEPTYTNGEPVEVIGTVTVNFKLGESAAPAPQQAAPTASAGQAEGSAGWWSERAAGFVGLWSERWGDINDTNSLRIVATPGGGLDVQPTASGWQAWEEEFDGRQLSFRMRGGSSNWEFRYTAEYDRPGRLKLRVHRLTDNQNFTGELIRGSGPSRAAPPTAPAPIQQAAAPAPAGLQAFVGTWSSKWADVGEVKGFTISVANGQPRVTRTGGWSVSGESFDGRVLSFRTEGGDSKWSFMYYLEYGGPNRLKLRVHRLHDNQNFTGEFTR